MENPDKTFYKINLQNILSISPEKVFSSKFKTKSITSLIQPNCNYLPTLKVQRENPKSKKFEVLKNVKFFSPENYNNYNELNKKKKKYTKIMENLSLNTICNFPKKTINQKNIKTETTCYNSPFMGKTLRKFSLKSIKTSKTVLEKYDFTNEKLMESIKKPSIKNECPARYNYNKLLPYYKDFAKNSQYQSQTTIKKPSQIIKKKSLASNQNTNEIVIEKKVKTEVSMPEEEEVPILPFETITNINIDSIEENLMKIEDDKELTSKQYLEIASDFKFKKTMNFEQIRRSLINALNMIFEMKLNLNDIREKKIFSTKPFQKQGSYELISAVKFGKMKEVKQLLQKNKYLVFDYDYVYYTPLHWACKRGFFEIAIILCENGADANAKDIIGRPPLYFTLSKGYHKISQVLLFFKADPWSNKVCNIQEFINKDKVIKKIVQKSRKVSFNFNALYIFCSKKLHIVVKMTPINRRKNIWEKERDNILLDSPYTEEIFQVFNKLKIKF